MIKNRSNIENEIKEVQIRITGIQETLKKLNDELKEEFGKLHALKEARFEVCNNIKKGDIIQDTEGVKYYYRGISRNWCGNPFLVNKINKDGSPSKNLVHVFRCKFDSATIKPSNIP